MLLRNEFSVPAGVAEVWPVLLDLERVVTCLPGAGLDSVEADHFTGRMSVRLGPTQLTYRGSGTMSADDGARRIAVKASGAEQRGSGSAAATIVATLHDRGVDKTYVEVETDLDITGKPAQFGRGMLQEVAGRLIGLFAERLEAQLLSGAEGAAGTSEPASPVEALDLWGLTRPALVTRVVPAAAILGAAAGVVIVLARRHRP